MRRAEGIHHPNIAKRGHLLRKLVVALLFALVAATVFQHHNFARLDVKTAFNPVLDQTNVFAEQFGHAFGNRCQGVFRLELTFGWAPQVGSDHYGRSLGERVLDAGKCCTNAGVVGDGEIVVLGNVQVGANEYSLAGDVKVGETFESHGSPRFRADVGNKKMGTLKCPFSRELLGHYADHFQNLAGVSPFVVVPGDNF